MVFLSKFISYLIANRNLIVRFGLVGFATFILNYFFVWLFYGVFALDYRVAVTIAYIITIAVHFTLNRTFTYNATESPIAHHASKYGVLLAINYVINLSVSIITVEVCGLSLYFAVIFATVIIMCSSFFLMKYFVFSHGE
jgi:putative flippase GtrA